ncbi:MAG: hypothetical protein U9O86_00585 [Campylobacterota bacterium]|nr:hypothetical protein [Campylobacterota bacterium]
MKFWTLTTLWTVSLLLLSACGAKPTPQKETVIDNTLPSVQLTNNGMIVGMKSIAFEWNNISDHRVRGIYVYKKTPSVDDKPSELQYFSTIDSRFKTHFVDSDVNPDTRYSYVFQTFKDDADGPKSKPFVVNTLPVLQSVSWIHSITGMPRVAKIIWRPHTNEKVKAYVVERKTLEDEKWEKHATVTGRLSAEYIDEELNDNYVYMYRVRVVTYDGITSTPSQIVKVVTKALPMSIKNIKTTTNLPHRIDIKWGESKEEDFALYYLYRSSDIDGRYELIAKLHNSKFSDKIDEDGKSYFYRVSCVDKDGLESENSKSSIQGVTLSRPDAPAIVEAKNLGKSIEIHWSQTDPRSVSYIVTKLHKKGWFKESSEEFIGIKSHKFIDTNVEPDSTYTYVVQSLDKHEIISEESVAVKIITPESTEIQRAPQAKVTEVKESVVAPVVETKEELISAPQDLDLSGL